MIKKISKIQKKPAIVWVGWPYCLYSKASLWSPVLEKSDFPE